MSLPEDWAEQLRAPFDPALVEWVPLTRKVSPSGKMLAAAYIDARTVMDRLDQVVGPDGWKVEYEEVNGGSQTSNIDFKQAPDSRLTCENLQTRNVCVKCRLSIRIGNEWVSKEDVGSPGSMDDAGSNAKTAYSDALKRAFVMWGGGRYLYQVENQWLAYDEKTRKFTERGKLPAPKQAAQKHSSLASKSESELEQARAFKTLSESLLSAKSLPHLQSVWGLVSKQISTGQFTAQQKFELEKTKDQCKAKLAAIAAKAAEDVAQAASSVS